MQLISACGTLFGRATLASSPLFQWYRPSRHIPGMLLAVILALISIALSPITGELIKVSGLSGGKAVIQCVYDGYYGTNQKYLCKGEVFKYCSDVIKNNLDEIFIEDQRFKLYDDRNQNVFTVTISSLSEEDAGTYWCGVDIYAAIDISTEVQLVVQKAQTSTIRLTSVSHTQRPRLDTTFTWTVVEEICLQTRGEQRGGESSFAHCTCPLIHPLLGTVLMWAWFCTA
ncbi:CMRF35-like molecule 5 [Brienomyrus brachyistius]|uniref:CMRF35-like molecule 5 n=1 Tax=Brienomyrus brachyistius TaxID=42636 RepID=UPI0020B41B22|nr:CMRF35-like molecule 5 [Brienomyrus brachyistius]